MPTVELSETTLGAIEKMTSHIDGLVRETGGRWGKEKSYDKLIRNAVVFWLWSMEDKKLRARIHEYENSEEGFSSAREFRKQYYPLSE